MAKTTPAEFIRQIRQEIGKVTWPTRRETMITTFMVLVMVAIMAAFFTVVDLGLSYGVRALLGLG